MAPPALVAFVFLGKWGWVDPGGRARNPFTGECSNRYTSAACLGMKVRGKVTEGWWFIHRFPAALSNIDNHVSPSCAIGSVVFPVNSNVVLVQYYLINPSWYFLFLPRLISRFLQWLSSSLSFNGISPRIVSSLWHNTDVSFCPVPVVPKLDSGRVQVESPRSVVLKLFLTVDLCSGLRNPVDTSFKIKQ